MHILRKTMESLSGRKIYVDLGTENTLIHVKGAGLTLNEPSFISFREAGNIRQPIAMGLESKRMLGRTPEHISITRPLHEGVIADFDATVYMLRSFIQKSLSRTSWMLKEMIISLPCKVSDFERQAIQELARSLRMKKTYLVDEPVLAALGSRLPIASPTGSMIVDIGGGTTEIAVMSLGGIIYSNAVRVGGHEMDKKILDYLRSSYNFLVGEPSAEWLKICHGVTLNASTERNIAVRGINLTTGLPSTQVISEDDIARAIEPTVRAIIEATKLALSEAPPEVSADLTHRGITLAGGVASLRGLPERLAMETGVEVHVSEAPLFSVARGGAVLLDRPDLLEMMARC